MEKWRKCGAKGLLSPPLSVSLLPDPRPSGFCSPRWQPNFLLPPHVAPAEREKQETSVPEQEGVPRPGRETPISPVPLQQLGEWAWGCGKGNSHAAPHHQSPSNLCVPLHPPQWQKAKLWLLRPLAFHL